LWVFSAALLQMFVPDRYRGRVFAFEFAALTLTQSLSIMGAGFAQDNLGLPLPTIAVRVGLSGLGVGLVWFLFHWRHLSDAKRQMAGISE
ncbi:MAG: MFS transporter, partial [Chloroflexi bacterium]|nr:MFS transporter [Chloroflexota bacterium]